MSLITCENVSLSYDGKPVVEGLNLAVEPGDFLSIVGENGTGKTTLLRGMVRLVLPSSGKIFYGEGLTRSQIGYLPQRMEAQRAFPATVWEVVVSGCRSDRLWLGKKAKARALWSMEFMSIVELRKESFTELSGGQQQRALLARALCAAERLLMLDEPFAGLDPLISRNLYQKINEQHDKQGLAVVMISHDIPAALQCARHILHLSHTDSFYGSPEEYAVSPLGKSFGNGDV